MDPEDIESDDRAHTGCYIFKPAAEHDDAEADDRPRKRRKTARSPSQDDGVDDDHTWPALLGGQESDAAIRLRKQQFDGQWDKYQATIDLIVNEVDETFVDHVLHYVRQDQGRSPGRIKAGLLVSIPTHNAQRDLLQGWLSRQARERDTKEILVALSPTHAPNMQTALKNVIRMAICQEAGLDGYVDFLARHKAMIPMSFDLELLQRYAQTHGIQRVLVSISDTETFDTTILSELVSMLASWSNRIPLILLIGISTTVELFESRLSRSTVSLLDANVFEPCRPQSQRQNDPLSAIYEAVQYSEDTQIFLGPAVVGVLAELAEDQSTTPETFARAIRYVFMSHFFANPLSGLSSTSDFKISDKPAICQAIRNTNGFKRYCEALSTGSPELRQKARLLLTSDEALGKEAWEEILAGRQRLRSSLAAIRVLQGLSRHLKPQGDAFLDMEAELLAALPDLIQTECFETIEQAMNGMDLPRFRAFFNEVTSILEDVEVFESNQPRGITEKMLTMADIEHAVNAVGNDASIMGDDEDASSTLIEAFLALLRRYIRYKTCPSPDTEAETNPFHRFMSEAFTYTLKSPLQSILHPRSRYSLERALTRPADYLGCDCCMSSSRTGEVPDRATLPATSLLLSLLNEAGHVVNVRDLWDAFRDTIAPALAGASSSSSGNGKKTKATKRVSSPDLSRRDEDGRESQDDDENEVGNGSPAIVDQRRQRRPEKPDGAEEDQVEDGDGDSVSSEAMERQALALFYRALADLRYLGFVKSSKRKPGVDCIAKTTWMGL